MRNRNSVKMKHNLDHTRLTEVQNNNEYIVRLGPVMYTCQYIRITVHVRSITIEHQLVRVCAGRRVGARCGAGGLCDWGVAGRGWGVGAEVGGGRAWEKGAHGLHACWGSIFHMLRCYCTLYWEATALWARLVHNIQISTEHCNSMIEAHVYKYGSGPSEQTWATTTIVRYTFYDTPLRHTTNAIIYFKGCTTQSAIIYLKGCSTAITVIYFKGCSKTTLIICLQGCLATNSIIYPHGCGPTHLQRADRLSLYEHVLLSIAVFCVRGCANILAQTKRSLNSMVM